MCPPRKALWQLQSVTAEHSAEIADLLAQDNNSSWSVAAVQASLQRPNYTLRKIALGSSSKNTAVAGFYFVQHVADEMTLLSIFVLPAFRKQGLGNAMLQDMLRLAKAKQCHQIFLEVRKSNRAAIALYGGFGFRQTGCRSGYYPAIEGGIAGAEDALLFALASSEVSVGECHAVR